MNNKDDDVDLIRMKLWGEVWCSVSGADNCNRVESPPNWADSCLEEFDNRFLKKVKGE